MYLHEQKAEITADDYYNLPHEFRKKFEVDYGKLVRLERHMPSYGHQRYGFWLAVAIDSFCADTDRSKHFVITEADCRLITTDPWVNRIPAVSVVPEWRAAREGPYPTFLEGAPDLAIEVKARTAKQADVMRKVEQYLSNGGRVVWVVAPSDRTLTVYRAGAPARVLTETDDVEDPDLLPGFRYPLRRLFELADTDPAGEEQN